MVLGMALRRSRIIEWADATVASDLRGASHGAPAAVGRPLLQVLAIISAPPVRAQRALPIATTRSRRGYRRVVWLTRSGLLRSECSGPIRRGAANVERVAAAVVPPLDDTERQENSGCWSDSRARTMSAMPRTRDS
jgi:hypothetical protein